MKNYSALDFLNDTKKQRIAVDIPKELLKILDDYIILNKIPNRKRFLELMVIKFILEKEKDLY